MCDLMEDFNVKGYLDEQHYAFLGSLALSRISSIPNLNGG